jgi:hypothetical protein
MPAPGVPPAVHVLHRGAARAGLCAHRQERGLPQGLQPGACATWRCSRSTPRMRATAITSTPPCAAFSPWWHRGAAWGPGEGGQQKGGHHWCQGHLPAGPAGQPPVRRRHHAAAGQGALPQPRLATGHPPCAERIARRATGARAGSATSCCPSTSWARCTRPCSATAASSPPKTCTRCKPAPKKARASADEDDGDGGDADDGDDTGSGSTSGGTPADMLDNAWFVPASRLPTTSPTSGSTRSTTPAAASCAVPQGQLHLPPGRPRPAEERQLLHPAGADPVPGEVRAEGTARRHRRENGA